MSKDALLELLKGAGVETSTLQDETLAKLTDEFTAVVAKSDPYMALQTELSKARKEAEDNDKRYREMTQVNSRQATKVSELEERLARAGQATNPMYEDALKGIREKVDALLARAEEAEKARVTLEAQVKRGQLVSSLVSKYPILADESLQALIPETADQAVLDRWAQGISRLNEQSLNQAYARVREGYVPPTAPPRVQRDKPETFEAEIKRIEKRVSSREITPEQGQTELMKLAQMMAPENK